MKEPINSVFTTMRAYNGKVFQLEKHVQRLQENMNAAGITAAKSKVPPQRRVAEGATKVISQKSKLAEFIKNLEEKIKNELKKSRLKNARIRVSIDGKNVNIMVTPLLFYPESYYSDGVKLITVPTTRNMPSATDAQIKSGNFLAGIMAKMESCGAFDAIMLDKDGYVAECTVSNLFIVRRSSFVANKNLKKRCTMNRALCTIVTPPPCLGTLNGITRNTVIEIAKKMGITVEEKPFTKYNLYNADECFLTSTTIEIMPAREIDTRMIGSGKPGQITKMLMDGFKKLHG